jgi:GGDEF domain-containing protein
MTRDPVAWLPNNQQFRACLASESRRAHRFSQSLSLILIGLEPPEGIGDSEREPTDLRLRWLVPFVVSNLSIEHICCHISAEQLAVIMPRTDSKACARVVTRLRSRYASTTARPPEIDGQLTIGSATWPDQGISIEDLETVAAAAMGRERLEGPPTADNIGRPEPGTRVQVWLEGLGHPIGAVVEPNATGLSLRARLPFLRLNGSARIRPLDSRESEASFVAIGSVQIDASADDQVPVLQVELTRADLPSGE